MKLFVSGMVDFEREGFAKHVSRVTTVPYMPIDLPMHDDGWSEGWIATGSILSPEASRFIADEATTVVMMPLPNNAKSYTNYSDHINSRYKLQGDISQANQCRHELYSARMVNLTHRMSTWHSVLSRLVVEAVEQR